MVLGIGLISALIIAKKNPKYLTRLQKLQKKLKNKPLNSITFYQIPTKKIFIIFIMICFMYFLQYFKNTYSEDLLQQNIEIPYEIEYLKVCKTVYWLKIVYCILIICLMSSMSWKTVEVDKNQIMMRDFPDKNQNKLLSKELQDKSFQIYIVQYSRQKFSHYLNYFSIQIKISQGQQSIQVLKRSNIYECRKSLIEMCSVLEMEPNLKIKYRKYI